MNYPWEKSFEIEFKTLLKIKDDRETKIIIGQEPYKYILNNKRFSVKSSKYPYNKIDDTVSFFVTDWIKIQDSLEMIFNLLFNGNVNSLRVLAFLREKQVQADDFADYLFKRYRLVLTNKKDITGKSNLAKINNVLQNENKDIYLLLVGSKICKIKRFKGVIKGRIEFIHSSGANINLNPQQYYSDWYQYMNKPAYLDKFRVFS